MQININLFHKYFHFFAHNRLFCRYVTLFSTQILPSSKRLHPYNPSNPYSTNNPFNPSNPSNPYSTNNPFNPSNPYSNNTIRSNRPIRTAQTIRSIRLIRTAQTIRSIRTIRTAQTIRSIRPIRTVYNPVPIRSRTVFVCISNPYQMITAT